MESLNDEFKKTIVMVTHDPSAAARSSRLIHLEKGILKKGIRSQENQAIGKLDSLRIFGEAYKQ